MSKQPSRQPSPASSPSGGAGSPRGEAGGSEGTRRRVHSASGAACAQALSQDPILMQIMEGLPPYDCLVLAGRVNRQFCRCARAPAYWKLACMASWQNVRIKDRLLQEVQAAVDQQEAARRHKAVCGDNAIHNAAEAKITDSGAEGAAKCGQPSSRPRDFELYSHNPYLTAYRDFMVRRVQVRPAFMMGSSVTIGNAAALNFFEPRYMHLVDCITKDADSQGRGVGGGGAIPLSSAYSTTVTATSHTEAPEDGSDGPTFVWVVDGRQPPNMEAYLCRASHIARGGGSIRLVATALNRVRVLGMHFVPVPPEKFGAEGLPPLPMVSFEEMPMKNGVPEGQEDENDPNPSWPFSEAAIENVLSQLFAHTLPGAEGDGMDGESFSSSLSDYSEDEDNNANR